MEQKIKNIWFDDLPKARIRLNTTIMKFVSETRGFTLHNIFDSCIFELVKVHYVQFNLPKLANARLVAELIRK